MAEKNILAEIPAPVWIGFFGLIAAGSVWGDLKGGAKELGKKTGQALEEVERSKDYLINLPEFQSNYFSKLAGKKIKQFKPEAAQALARELESVKGFFNDNEEKLFSILSKISYKTQLAQVAKIFSSSTGKSLGAYLISFTNTNERHRIEKMFNNLSSGIL